MVCSTRSAACLTYDAKYVLKLSQGCIKAESTHVDVLVVFALHQQSRDKKHMEELSLSACRCPYSQHHSHSGRCWVWSAANNGVHILYCSSRWNIAAAQACT
jgi:aminopeptidase C